MMQPIGQPMPIAAPPTPDVACASELIPPDSMQMMENEMAKLWNGPMRRDNSWA